MSETRDSPAGAGRLIPWHERYPDRWRREVAELKATGWEYDVSYDHRHQVRLAVAYPLADGEVATLQVRFWQTYPFFPPRVLDVAGALDLGRHWNPASKELCLIHEDWRTEMTVARLLREQLPKALATGSDHLRDEEIAAGSEFEGAHGRGLEFPVPEPVAVGVGAVGAAIIVNDVAIPPGEQGALVVRFDLVPGTNRLGAGVVEAIFGPRFRADVDLDEQRLVDFVLPMAGRWIRDPDYRTGESPEQVWRRVAPRLAPLEVEFDSRKARPLDPDVVEVIGLLVPDEVGFRRRGESWVFLVRALSSDPAPATGRCEWSCRYRPTQYLARNILSERTPVSWALSGKSAVLVGVGAVGTCIAQDLVQTGLGQLTLIDGDTADVATSPRQVAPLVWAGLPKAFLLQEMLRGAAPYSRVDGVWGDVELLWDQRLSSARLGSFNAAADVRRAVAAADLVVDATADPVATRFLAAWCRSLHTPFLHASATAGGWGGVVALLSQETGCWACVEHARADRLLPVPAADPDGWISPRRSCATRTFTGTRPDLAQISHHASTVAIAHLTGAESMGDYFTAAMRDQDGRRQPIAWTSDPLPVHTACQAHEHRPSAEVDLAVARKSEPVLDTA